jgi:hypothetical protein
MLADPTHRRSFSERTLDFFDPDSPACRERPYYSSARFRIRRKVAYIKFFYYLPVSWRPLARCLFFLARYLGAVVWVVEFELMLSK